MTGRCIDPAELRAYQRRSRAEHVEAKRRLNGSSGAASACVRLDPKTLQPICVVEVHALQAASLATEASAIGVPPKFRSWDERKATLNRARVAGCAARGDVRRVGGFEYGGEWLTVLVGLGYLSDEESLSYDPARWRAFNAILLRAMTALITDVVAGKIRLMH